MYQFLRFPEWKDKAISLSYDDGKKDDIRLIEIMKRYGLKGTFNVCSTRLLNAPTTHTPIEVYLQAGMELAMHGEKHLWVNACQTGEIIKEFYQDKLALESLSGEIIRGGAYAYGCYNEQALSVLKTLGISYFRTTQEANGFDIPTDWLRMPITCRHKDERLLERLDEFLAERSDKPYAQTPRLFLLMGHSWEFSKCDNWEVIETFGERVAKRDDVWNATNIQIFDYVKAYESLIFSTAGDKVLNVSPLDVYLCVDGKNVLAKANATTLII